MKVMTIIGARPQFVKAAVVSRALNEQSPSVKEIIVHTGQHYDANMSDVFFDELDIPRPDFNLGIGGGSHGQNTGRMIEHLEKLMLEEQPDRVLVYGDTDSTLAGALAAAKLNTPVAHVEAGLRSFNRKMPEEINRILTDHIADLLFVPTETGRLNLLREGIPEEKIYLVGDVMYDAAVFYRQRASKPTWFDELAIEPGHFVLCTVHRAENSDSLNKMSSIFLGLKEAGLPVILPLHPRTRDNIKKMGIVVPDNVYITQPVGYLQMVWLEMNCLIVATDSGGVQKEAYFHNKTCVTLREETEWTELVESGGNKLAGANSELISKYVRNASKFDYQNGLYGDGQSAYKIIGSLL